MNNKETEEYFLKAMKNINARDRLNFQIQIQSLHDNVDFLKFSHLESYVEGYKDALKNIIELIAESSSRDIKEMQVEAFGTD